ncbi:MAG TPA: aminopeptidase [Candidatus Eisenbacteria bacterium]
MSDPRSRQLAKTIVRHSCRLERGETVLIEAFDVADGLIHDLVDEAFAAGAIPLVYLRDNALIRRILLHGNDAQLAKQAEIELFQMKQAQAYVGIRASENVAELADVPPAHMALQAKLLWKPVHSDYRVPKTKWVVLRYPNPAMAQLANMSTEAFERFYYDVCCVDYERMEAAIRPLRALMERTDRVRLTAPGTDLHFSVKGIGVVSCHGDKNIPDGECYTAPVRDSVEGTLAYNTPTLYQGTSFRDVRLTFERGRIVKAEGNPADRLNQILDQDEGARYVGEFSLGFNPKILHPMNDALFDEKIAGSLHFTPGQAYEQADNGNRSQVHWDMVLIQRPDYGGGDVWFDDTLIRKDGRFVVKDLLGLNPEALGAA